MGHGTSHHANAVYAALDYMLKEMGYPNIFMGTVEAYPDLQTLIAQVKKTPAKRVHLCPFMLVAGDHANNDMAGDQKSSWKSLFEASGYEVICHLKGLGEYAGIRNINLPLLFLFQRMFKKYAVIFLILEYCHSISRNRICKGKWTVVAFFLHRFINQRTFLAFSSIFLFIAVKNQLILFL